MTFFSATPHFKTPATTEKENCSAVQIMRGISSFLIFICTANWIVFVSKYISFVFLIELCLFWKFIVFSIPKIAVFVLKNFYLFEKEKYLYLKMNCICIACYAKVTWLSSPLALAPTFSMNPHLNNRWCLTWIWLNIK